MHTSEANIEIIRRNGKLISLSVIMPTWKQEDGHKFIVTIPLFAIKTSAKNHDDADTAIEEALKSFCIQSEKFGQGIEKELESIGWKVKSASDNITLLNFSTSDTDIVLEQIMETGDQFAQEGLQLQDLVLANA